MNGASPQAPNGAATANLPKRPGPAPHRRRPQTNVLVTKRKPVGPKAPLAKAPLAKAPTPTNSSSKQNTSEKPTRGITPSANPPRQQLVARTSAFAKRPPSPEPPGTLTRTPIFLTKRALLEGLRHHVARMQSKTPVSIADGRAFQRPVTLHRRDPNAQSAEQDQPTPDPEEVAKEELLDKEKERVEAFKAEAKRLKEENQKHIAPSLSSNPKKKQSKKRRFQQVFRPNDTPEEQKKNQLRYEEAYPWHVEDFDHKQVWMGGYEQTLSESHLLLVREGASARVIPLEKYYRFKEKRQVEQMHPDQVHKTLERNPKVPRFIVEFQEQQKKKDKQNENASHRRFAKKGGAQFAGTSTKGVNKEAEDVLFANEDVPEGAEEMDFENDDLFDDDDEDPVLEGDTEEVLKERLNKIKKEQLEANIFDMVDEEDVDKEEEVEAKRAEFTRKAKKKTKKLLLSKEQNYNYEDDSDDENPYSSESEDEEPGAEDEAEEQASPEKKAEQGSSTKGDTTPSGRKKGGVSTLGKSSIKLSGDVEMSEASGNESTRKKKQKLKVPNLKRPGSPEVSGVSGNESSRKKQKLSNLNPSMKVAPNRKVSALKAGAGSGSESENSKRLKGNRKNTPSGSRAASPAAQSTGSGGVSRSGSPSAPDGPLPTAAEIIAAIPPEGISMTNLVKKFASSKNKERVQQLVPLIRRTAQVSQGQVTRKP